MMMTEAKVNSDIVELRIKAREIARDALLLGLDELSALVKEQSGLKRDSTYESFWQEVQTKLDKARPPKEPEMKRNGPLAEHQRSHGAREVESRYGGEVVSETKLAWLAKFEPDNLECWLPKNLVQIMWNGQQPAFPCATKFDCIIMPAWIAAEKNIDWLNDDDE